MRQIVYQAKIVYQETSVLDGILHVFERFNARMERQYGRVLDSMADYVIKKMEL